MSLSTETLVGLSQPIDPARVKQRQGAGRRTLDYLETHDVIRRANDLFGFGEWGFSTELVQLGEEPCDNGKTGTQRREGFRVGYRATVTLTVTDCEPTCGVGYGDAVEYTGSRITPHELAAKEAESDGLKRALKNWGDQFGLSLYAKDGAVRAPQPAEPPAFQDPTTTPATGEQRGKLRVVATRVLSAGLITREQLDSAVQNLTTNGEATFADSMALLTGKQVENLIGRLERKEQNREVPAA